MKLTFLGTSTSVGVPVIGCSCHVCVSENPKLQRMRSSVHIQTASLSLLVDSGPDLRQQALRHSLRKVDAVFYTHQHLDHTAGFDELRAFCWDREDPLPLYSTPECLDELKRVYNWAFEGEFTHKGYIRPKAMPILGPVKLADVVVTPIPVEHGSVVTVGYRFDDSEWSVAYIPDIKVLKAGSAELLKDLDHLIIDCLREDGHTTHLSLVEALDIIEQANPKEAWLTHVAHEMDVEKVELMLPANVNFAYDTLTLSP